LLSLLLHLFDDETLLRFVEQRVVMTAQEPQFQSQVFEEIARALAPEIATAVQSGELLPPLEVLLEDAGNRLVCRAEMDGRGAFRSLLDSDPPLHAKFPVKASVTDRSGNVWHASFDVAELPSLG
jgi:hypothetical protein